MVMVVLIEILATCANMHALNPVAAMQGKIRALLKLSYNARARSWGNSQEHLKFPSMRERVPGVIPRNVLCQETNLFLLFVLWYLNLYLL